MIAAELCFAVDRARLTPGGIEIAGDAVVRRVRDRVQRAGRPVRRQEPRRTKPLCDLVERLRAATAIIGCHGKPLVHAQAKRFIIESRESLTRGGTVVLGELEIPGRGVDDGAQCEPPGFERTRNGRGAEQGGRPRKQAARDEQRCKEIHYVVALCFRNIFCGAAQRRFGSQDVTFALPHRRGQKQSSGTGTIVPRKHRSYIIT
ncbi:MAG: hypothetical protein M3169_03925 [Candidatus Eremiobacteraeota bacterium]|nr:hypothetical protein [Candidatus Eremiobacteraeota bacterium]